MIIAATLLLLAGQTDVCYNEFATEDPNSDVCHVVGDVPPPIDIPGRLSIVVPVVAPPPPPAPDSSPN